MIGNASRRQHSSQKAISVGGSLEPVEPAYYISRAPGAQLNSAQQVPSEPTSWQAPVVWRGPRKAGMRYLYARGAVRQPISQLGTGPDLGVAVWSSDAQPDLMGPVHDAGFNDALFQAGYPGFNLGLSFKVQKLKENETGGPGQNIKMSTPNRLIQITKLASGKFQASTTSG